MSSPYSLCAFETHIHLSEMRCSSCHHREVGVRAVPLCVARRHKAMVGWGLGSFSATHASSVHVISSAHTDAAIGQCESVGRHAHVYQEHHKLGIHFGLRGHSGVPPPCGLCEQA